VRKRLASLLVVAGATAALALAAVPAQADPTWTVTGPPDGKFTGTAGVTTLKNGSVTLTCKTASADGTAQIGTGLPGANIASITAASFNNCSGAGLTFTVVPTMPWALNAVSYVPDVTTGTITGVQAHLQGPACAADVTGSVAGTLTNSTDVLAIDPALNAAQGTQLTISNVVNCLGLLHNGDHPTFTAQYQVAPTVTITSP
jgi:hypothetical protein